MKTVELNQRVVRSIGDYVVGRVGTVEAIDATKNRAQVNWDGAPRSWVLFNALEPENIPYRIEPGCLSKTKKRRNGDPMIVHPKYIRI